MKFGISTFVNDDTIDTVTLARAIEERGFESLAIAEHTHIPASRESAYPMGGDLPSIYYRTLDPFVTLAAAAAVTSRIELITGIALLTRQSCSSWSGTAPSPMPALCGDAPVVVDGEDLRRRTSDELRLGCHRAPRPPSR